MWRDEQKTSGTTRGDVARTVAPLVFVLVVTTGLAHSQHSGPSLVPFGYLWLIVTALPLLVVRGFPLPVFLVTSALAGSYYVSDFPGGPAIVLPTFALFMLTRQRGPMTAGIAGGAVVLAGFLAYLLTGHHVTYDARIGLFVLWVVAVVGIATAVRDRLAAVGARRAQAAEHQARVAEQERLRIAREVHDVVAHSLAMINVQAGVAAHVADRRPEQAKEALLNIKKASAAALNDLRATVAVLRSGEDRAPMPSLVQMADLLDHARAAGLTVRVHGEPGELPAPTDGAAYRILQESLTNVVRHAEEPSEVDVHFERRDGKLVLLVRDDGRGAAEPKIGNGLRGMRERADALGGFVRAAPVEGGFEVRAELPTGETT